MHLLKVVKDAMSSVRSSLVSLVGMALAAGVNPKAFEEISPKVKRKRTKEEISADEARIAAAEAKRQKRLKRGW